MFSRWTMIIHGTLHRLVDTSRLSNSITKTPTFNTNLQDGIFNKAKVLKKNLLHILSLSHLEMQ